MKHYKIAQSLIVITIISCLASSAFGLKFNIPTSIIQQNSQWTRVKPGVDSAHPVQLIYDEYPQGWNHVLNYIYIPGSQRQYNRKYPCRIRAKSLNDTEIKSTILFTLSNEKVYLSNLLFPYDQIFDDSFFNSGIFNGVPNMTNNKNNQVNNFSDSLNQTDFAVQQDIVDKMSTVSQMPGTGIKDLLQTITDNSMPVSIVHSEDIIKLRQQLQKNATVKNLTLSINSVESKDSIPTLSAANNQNIYISIAQISQNKINSVNTSSSTATTSTVTNTTTNPVPNTTNIKPDNNTTISTQINQTTSSNTTNKPIPQTSNTTTSSNPINNTNINSNVSSPNNTNINSNTNSNTTMSMNISMNSSNINDNVSSSNVSNTTSNIISSPSSDINNINNMSDVINSTNSNTINNTINTTNNNQNNVTNELNNNSINSNTNIEINSNSTISANTNTNTNNNISNNITNNKNDITNITNTSNSSISSTISQLKNIQQKASSIPISTIQQFISPSIGITASTPVNTIRPGAGSSILVPPSAPTLPTAPILLSNVSLQSFTTRPQISSPIFAPVSLSTAVSVTGAPALVVSPGSSGSLSTSALADSQKQLDYINMIKSTQIQQISQQKTIQSIFFKLPGPQELDSIILAADSFSLMKVIQKVVSSGLTCEQKISYLSQLLGRIQSAISMKAFAVMQLGVIVQGSQIQIDRLNQRINQTQTALDGLGLTNLRNKLSSVLVDLQKSYSIFNMADSQIPIKQTLISNYKYVIQLATVATDNTRQQLPLQKIQLNQMNNQISQIQSKLIDARAKRDVFQNNINQVNNSIKGYDDKIAQDKKNISDLQTQINKRLDQAARLKNQYQDLQVNIQIQKQNITTIQKRQQQINVLLPNLQDRVVQQNQILINTAQLQKAKAQANNLQTILPTIKSKMDENNFKCNQVQTVQPVKAPVEQVKQVVQVPKIQLIVNKTEPASIPTPTPTPAPAPPPASPAPIFLIPIALITSYQIPVKQYHNYVNTCYKIKPQNPNLQVVKTVITPLSIMDPLWIQNFGTPNIYDVLPFNQVVDLAVNLSQITGNTNIAIPPFGSTSLNTTNIPSITSAFPNNVIKTNSNSSFKNTTALTSSSFSSPVIIPLAPNTNPPIIVPTPTVPLTDFNCLNPQYLQSGWGIIKNVNRKFVQIQDQQGYRTNLNLAGCSRIQATQQIPKVGQKIYFRGRRINNNSYNIYRGACI